ncbi:hypothetical protein HSR121_1202 [Halapricum desulfuricans]|uniref:Uncharacterized protein n=1 Tax=Halapricum desulfuricans TaxID=2841257 RepID=A0A897N356_9EURY|nr:hypothetical protein HSR121_1202 [Halapricum desulfuricans]
MRSKNRRGRSRVRAAAGSKPPSVRPGIRLSVRAASGLPCGADLHR